MSEFRWSDEATKRLEQVPEGFMRNMTRKRVEEHAQNNKLTDITLDVAETVIDTSRAGMGSMMGGDMSDASAENMPPEMAAMMGERKMGDESPPQQESKPEANQDTTLYYFCFVCSYTLSEIPEKCPRCAAPKDKFSELKQEFLTSAHTFFDLKWSQNAIDLLKSVPDSYRNMTRWEVESYCRKSGHCAVTADLVEERIGVWKSISDKFKPTMEWEPDIIERVQKIPESIRGMVMREMEIMSAERGMVTQETFDKIKTKWEESREFHVKWM